MRRHIDEMKKEFQRTFQAEITKSVEQEKSDANVTKLQLLATSDSPHSK